MTSKPAGDYQTGSFDVKKSGVNIVVNGNSIDVPRICTVIQLLSQLEIDNRHVAIELNREILPHEDHPSRCLAENDNLEIVTFVGGG